MNGEFQCRQCGNCCRHAGEVRLAEGEAESIAEMLGMTVADFTGQFTRLRDDRRGLSLIDAHDGACIFLARDPFACRIQVAKPKQCRDFPLDWKYEDWERICAAARIP